MLELKGILHFEKELLLPKFLKREWICTGKVSLISKSLYLSPTISTKKDGFIMYWRRFIAHNNAHALVNNSKLW